MCDPCASLPLAVAAPATPLLAFCCFPFGRQCAALFWMPVPFPIPISIPVPSSSSPAPYPFRVPSSRCCSQAGEAKVQSTIELAWGNTFAINSKSDGSQVATDPLPLLISLPPCLSLSFSLSLGCAALSAEAANAAGVHSSGAEMRDRER